MPRHPRFPVSQDDLALILAKLDRLHHIRDLHTLLDSLLTETRQFVKADAGSIFLVEDGALKFSYVQNDSLFRADFLSNKYIYSNGTVPLDQTSLAGFVAVTGQPLVIDDAYQLPATLPYTFNAKFDEISQYRTTSILIVPLVTGKKESLGVLELINAQDEAGKVVPFTEDQKNFVGLFAFYAGVAIERALLLRDVVKKMLTMTQIRDPEETQPHVERVGAYSGELYQRWAEKRGVPREQIASYKDVLRTAAMLHDIGKVGIPDALLQKNGPLSEQEFDQMKTHVAFGAEFFKNPHSNGTRWPSRSPSTITSIGTARATPQRPRKGRGYRFRRGLWLWPTCTTLSSAAGRIRIRGRRTRFSTTSVRNEVAILTPSWSISSSKSTTSSARSVRSGNLDL
jgi:hypothetical protein